jgi:hypothetical protein
MPMDSSCVVYGLYYTVTILHGATSSPYAHVYPFWAALYGDTLPPTEELIIRVFAVGLMLADKWLNCSTYRITDWYVSIGYLIQLVSYPSCGNRAENLLVSRDVLFQVEKASLKILDYQLRIKTDVYQSWLEHLADFHLTFSRIPSEAHAIVGRVIKKVILASKNGLVASSDSMSLPPPAKWDPSADPILRKGDHRVRRSPHHKISTISGSNDSCSKDEVLAKMSAPVAVDLHSVPRSTPLHRPTALCRDDSKSQGSGVGKCSQIAQWDYVRMIFENYPIAARSALSRLG